MFAVKHCIVVAASINLLWAILRWYILPLMSLEQSFIYRPREHIIKYNKAGLDSTVAVPCGILRVWKCFWLDHDKTIGWNPICYRATDSMVVVGECIDMRVAEMQLLVTWLGPATTHITWPIWSQRRCHCVKSVLSIASAAVAAAAAAWNRPTPRTHHWWLQKLVRSNNLCINLIIFQLS